MHVDCLDTNNQSASMPFEWLNQNETTGLHTYTRHAHYLLNLVFVLHYTLPKYGVLLSCQRLHGVTWKMVLVQHSMGETIIETYAQNTEHNTQQNSTYVSSSSSLSLTLSLFLSHSHSGTIRHFPTDRNNHQHFDYFVYTL